MEERNNKPIKLPDSIYWRYKKNKPPEDDFGSAAGPVKVVKTKRLPLVKKRESEAT